MTGKILVANPYPVAQAGLANILEENLTQFEVDFADTYQEVKDKVANGLFLLIILDIDILDDTTMSMIKELRILQKKLLIIIFCSSEKVELKYIQEGANGFINKFCNTEVIINTINGVIKEGSYYSKNVIQDTTQAYKNSYKPLTKRESEVFNLLAEGNGNIEIAGLLKITESTVSSLKYKLYKKLKIKNLVELLQVHKALNDKY